MRTLSKGAGNRVLDGVRGDLLPRTIPIPKVLRKSRLIPKRLKYQGLDISIENPAGSIRTGTDQDGHEWRSLLHFDYGYILSTLGVDGDLLDCFIGPNKDAPNVFIIHQKNVKTGAFDEDKCMLGWLTKADAKRDYLLNYDRSDQYMGMTVMPIEEFKTKALATRAKPMMIKSKIKAHIRRTRSGKVVQVREHQDIRSKKVRSKKSKGMGFIKVGAVPAGSIKIPGTKITKAGDIAAIFRGMRDDAREKYWVVGTKKDGSIVSVELHSMGGITTSAVDPRVIVSVLRANKAKQYWGIHNHSSGGTNPSMDDYNITNQIKSLAGQFGIEHKSDVIIHGGRDTYSEFAERRLVDYGKEVPTPEKNWVEHPISEIKVTKRESLPSGMPNTPIISGGGAARLGKWIQDKHGKGVWGITLNAKNMITGFYLLGDNHLNLSETRGKYNKALLKHMMDTGSINCITVGSHPNKRDAHSYRDEAEHLFKSTGYTMLDAVFETGQGYYSVESMSYTGIKKSMMLIKSRIKAHTRKLKSGKVVGVTEHIRHQRIGGIGNALRVEHILSDNIDYELWVSSKGSVVRMYDRDGKTFVLHQRYPSGMEEQARKRFKEVTKYA